MTPIDIKVKGQAYFLYVGEGGISVLQTSIFPIDITPSSMLYVCQLWLKYI